MIDPTGILEEDDLDFLPDTEDEAEVEEPEQLPLPFEDPPIVAEVEEDEEDVEDEEEEDEEDSSDDDTEDSEAS